MSKLLKSFPKVLWVFILILTLVPVIRYPKKFFSQTMIEFEGRQYARSQYVRGGGARNLIDDATLYTYAGYTYIKGEDPTAINFEHPPLGKYLLGLSYLMFGNPVILNLVLYAAALVMIYYLAWKVIKEQSYAIIAVLIVGTFALVQDHVSEALLDFPQLVAILGFFVCLFSQNRKKYLWAGVILGLLMSIKYIFPTILLFIGFLFYWSITEKAFKQFFVGVTAAMLTYLATYAVYFWHHPNPIEYVKFELFRLHWWFGDRSMPKFLIFHTIFTGQFKGWWAAYAIEIAHGWSLSWPLLLITQFLSGIFLLIRRNKHAFVLFVYAQAMLAVFALGAASYARYLIPLLPFWAILSVWGGKNFIEAIQRKQPAANKLRGSRSRR